MAQDPRGSPKATRRLHEAPQDAPERPNILKKPCVFFKCCSLSHFFAPKSPGAQDSPNIPRPQSRPQEAPGGPKMAPTQRTDTPGRPPGVSKMTQDLPKAAPRSPPWPSRAAPRPHRRPQDPQRLPEDPQQAPKRPKQVPTESCSRLLAGPDPRRHMQGSSGR